MTQVYEPGQFDASQHFYPRALNAQLHPLVAYFFSLSNERIIERYTHLNPTVKPEDLERILSCPMQHFHWAGSDLFYVTTEAGNRRMVVLETNSCPSGQKSMPSQAYENEYRGYRNVLESSFLPLLKKRRLPTGVLAVIFDKNTMEASGYAATLADLTNEPVYLVDFNETSTFYFEDGVLMIDLGDGQVRAVRAAFRYVTQKPWTKIPLHTKTLIFNSTLACLAGGRNKLIASKAYEFFNASLEEANLSIQTPHTIHDVSKVEVPLWVKQFGGFAVVKDPYSNAGQGVYIITSEAELDDFMAQEYHYDQFIVQSLIGDSNWSSVRHNNYYYHIGTVPTRQKQRIYVADIRMMVYSSPAGFRPCAIYSRRAHAPLRKTVDAPGHAREMLCTNLSYKQDGQWQSDTQRLLLVDEHDFNTIGIGLDDLIEAYIQTILSVSAIDQMCQQLLNKNNKFKRRLFGSLNSDAALLDEIVL